MLNQTYYTRSWGHYREQVRNLQIKPGKLDLQRNRSYNDWMKGYYEEEKGMLNKLLTACEKGHYETAFFVAIGVQDGLARILYAAEQGRWPGMFDLGEYREIYYRFGYPDLTALLDPNDFEPLRIAVLQLIEKFFSAPL